MPVARPGARPGPARFFHGWIVVTGAFLILFMAYGTQYWWLSAGFNALALILLGFARPPAPRALA